MHTHTHCERLLNFPHTPIPGPGCQGDNFKMTPYFKKPWEKSPFQLDTKYYSYTVQLCYYTFA